MATMGAEKASLGERVKAAREAAGLTQMQVASAAGIALSTLAQLEQGKMENPRLSTLRNLASALKVKLVDLMDD